MVFIQDDDMIEEFLADTPHPALGKSVLPWFFRLFGLKDVLRVILCQPPLYKYYLKINYLCCIILDMMVPQRMFGYLSIGFGGGRCRILKKWIFLWSLTSRGRLLRFVIRIQCFQLLAKPLPFFLFLQIMNTAIIPTTGTAIVEYSGMITVVNTSTLPASESEPLS